MAGKNGLGISEEERNEMIQLLHDDGYRNAAGLSSIEDDEWKDYKVPKSVQKAIKKVLASNSSGGGGGMSSSV